MEPVRSAPLLAATLILLAAATAQAQPQGQSARNCNVRQDPTGLIRGDQVPKGCVLPSTGGDRYAIQPPRQWSTALGPCEEYSERIDFTPNPKYSTLANAARICKPLLEASDPANWPGGEEFESFQNEFGNAPRHFGATQRNFGSSQRHFGSTQRNFGSSQRHFGSTQRNFGSTQRHFGRQAGGKSGG